MSKKIQEKKSKKPTQLDRIEALARSAHAESGLAHAATLALQQRIDAMRHEQAALSQESRSAPVEDKAKEEQRAKEAEWAKYDVLQPGDQCDRRLTKEEVFEVLSLGLPSSPAEILSTSCRCLVWTNDRIGGNYNPEDRHNSIAFPEFIRRARGTAAKRAEEERAKELAKVPEFGNRVEVIGREGELWKVGCDEPTDDGYWRLCPSKCGNLNTMTAKRHEFQIID